MVGDCGSVDAGEREGMTNDQNPRPKEFPKNNSQNWVLAGVRFGPAGKMPAARGALGWQ